MEDLKKFAETYTPQMRDKIAFVGNGEDGEDLVDPNEAFRTELMAYVVQELKEETPFALVKDLFIETAKWAQEAYQIPHAFSNLSELYLCVGKGQDLLLYWETLDSSMDTYICGLNITLPKAHQPGIEQGIQTAIDQETHPNRKTALKKIELILKEKFE